MLVAPIFQCSGEVDQSGGSMLSDDVQEKGFVLLCCGRPVGDCVVKTVPEVRLFRGTPGSSYHAAPLKM